MSLTVRPAHPDAFFGEWFVYDGPVRVGIVDKSGPGIRLTKSSQPLNLDAIDHKIVKAINAAIERHNTLKGGLQ
jgi:hypothetical protein